ncbi:uncharacterized protein LOC143593513 [Bidens hawaiensis]|uniref:uncharacterized protein LOC143593513 n=1 Tax=Bidens hawaiensis TaxID=980011 RepID=UPI00404AF310
MGSAADDLTFKIIFSRDGAARLRNRVKDKLKEFMGDYTDDTLVEYVIVLLKNGRCKEEARNELNVFLGDDSDSFVSWLWGHLQSNLNLYTQSKESRVTDEHVSKQKPVSESVVIKSDTISKSRRVKDWKGVITEPAGPPPLRSAVIANIHSDDDNNNLNRSSSSQPSIQRKRGRNVQTDHPDESSQVKRETVSKPTPGGATRRLLQFAVRDAVGTSRSASLTSEPSFKRLRSAVSTPTNDSSLEHCPPKIRSKAMAVAIKAVADAAHDVVKVKPSGNVFDRLGHTADASDTIDRVTDYGKHEADVPAYSGQYVEDISMMEHDVGLNSNKPHRVENITVSDVANIYSNLNKPRGVSELDNQKLDAGNNSNPVTVSNANGVPITHVQSEVDQKSLSSIGVNPTGKSTEDEDSRIIFVSNVHFAATKDSLTRHFNKFGDVLKVLILTEPATGQPIGSAYVEFMTKEAAENALSLDSTSFMSRILKVVKKNSDQQLVAPVNAWACGARGSPYVASRFGRGSFARGGIPSAYRSHLPFKGGVRSFQWKRDAQNPSSDSISSPTAIPSPTTARSLTYVRTEVAKSKNSA